MESLPLVAFVLRPVKNLESINTLGKDWAGLGCPAFSLIGAVRIDLSQKTLLSGC
jgi:hypothetical protein